MTAPLNGLDGLLTVWPILAEKPVWNAWVLLRIRQWSGYQRALVDTGHDRPLNGAPPAARRSLREALTGLLRVPWDDPRVAGVAAVFSDVTDPRKPRHLALFCAAPCSRDELAAWLLAAEHVIELHDRGGAS